MGVTTLLNPGGGPCNDCCRTCDDYYDPNEWYATFCDIPKFADGFDNYYASPGLPYWYYGPHTINDAINGMLLNWQFALTEPVGLSAETRLFHAKIPMDEVDQTFSVFFGRYGFGNTQDPSEQELEITISNTEAEIIVSDTCHPLATIHSQRIQRSTQVNIWCDVSSPDATFDRPNKYTYYLWRANRNGSGAPCSQMPLT